MTPQVPVRLAGIDIGSNSIRMVVAEVTADGTDYRTLDECKETTRLARGLSTTGQIAPEALAQSLEALRRMRAIIQGYGVSRLEVIATSAVREAANGAEFKRLVKDQLDLAIEVITPEEEGRLSFLSAVRRFNLRDQNVVLVDLGGGSAEVVFGARGNIEQILSLPVGAVRMAEAYLKSDPPTAAEFKSVGRCVRRHLVEQGGDPTFQPHFMIGAGGTFTALAALALRWQGRDADRLAGAEVTRGEVRHVLHYLSALSLAARREVAGLNPDRADIIVAGVVVVERLMKWAGVNRLVVHDRGVRDGLVLRMIGAPAGPAPASAAKGQPPELLAAVRQFGAACGIEEAHARQVTDLAGQLFEQLREALKLPPEVRPLLEAAAWLHEVGSLINYKRHHRHSYHLILHGNFHGLTPRQREIVAHVARYHRKSGPKPKHKDFARLVPADQDIVRRLSALLRVADGLDRTHLHMVQSVRCELHNGTVRVLVSAAVAPDVDLWGAAQKGKLFEKVFDKKLEFFWQPPGAAAGAPPAQRKPARVKRK